MLSPSLSSPFSSPSSFALVSPNPTFDGSACYHLHCRLPSLLPASPFSLRRPPSTSISHLFSLILLPLHQSTIISLPSTPAHLPPPSPYTSTSIFLLFSLVLLLPLPLTHCASISFNPHPPPNLQAPIHFHLSLLFSLIILLSPPPNLSCFHLLQPAPTHLSLLKPHPFSSPSSSLLSSFSLLSQIHYVSISFNPHPPPTSKAPVYLHLPPPLSYPPPPPSPQPTIFSSPSTPTHFPPPLGD